LSRRLVPPPASVAPAHERIRNDLAAAIKSGQLAPDDRLPSEAELAARYGVARMTVRQALTGLVNDGLVVRRQGVGTFVVDHALRRNIGRLSGLTEDMRADGRVVQTRMLAQRIVPAPADVAASLGLAPEAHVIHLARVRIVDDEPMIVQHSWVPYELFPELWSEPLIEDSLYSTLRARYDVTLRRADQRIAAEPATKELALLLAVRPGAPLLRIERVTRDDRNTAIEFARSWTRPGFEVTTSIER
jgi:GntR family transcriptional regulator